MKQILELSFFYISFLFYLLLSLFEQCFMLNSMKDYCSFIKNLELNHPSNILMSSNIIKEIEQQDIHVKIFKQKRRM